MALIVMVNAIFFVHHKGARRFPIGNVKESALKLRRFAFDVIFRI